jgi:hypothetical protein
MNLDEDSATLSKLTVLQLVSIATIMEMPNQQVIYCKGNLAALR